MNITLDIAALAAAILWPLVVIVLLLAYRKYLPGVIQSVSSRLKKIEFGGVSLELAEAKPFDPQWENSPGNIDLRHHAKGSQIVDSTVDAFYKQLVESEEADYAIVNLGSGKEWLSTRLYILSIVFARAKHIKRMVFLESAAGRRKQFLGIASPESVRWALAKAYPWLESAFADVYNQLVNQYPQAKVSSIKGQLDRITPLPPDTLMPPVSILLVQEFIQRVQNTVSLPLNAPAVNDWPVLSGPNDPEIKEAASWLDGGDIERLLGAELSREHITQAKDAPDLQEVVNLGGEFLPLVEKDGRFKALLKRDVLLAEFLK